MAAKKKTQTETPETLEPIPMTVTVTTQKPRFERLVSIGVGALCVVGGVILGVRIG